MTMAIGMIRAAAITTMITMEVDNRATMAVGIPVTTGLPNNDQGRNWDSGGHRDSGGGAGDQHGGNANAGQGQPPAANVIHVISATYGATCHQPAGNVTKFLADACNGKGVCQHTVQYQAIGDPSPGCAKDFSVQWTCSVGTGGNVSVPAEAGLGSKVTLQCIGH